MASILKVNTFTGASTAGSIAVTGEGNSTTTNLQQGLAKAWACNEQDGTNGVLDSFNQASITDIGNGQHSGTRTNNMASVNWTVGFLTSADGSSNDYSMVHCGMRTANGTLSDKSTSLVSCYVKNSSHSGLDLANVGYQIFGDLA
tara:strand:+ start:333 stop:767 length:435 start_codon:yes stop_codon:yes gene_type:complete